MTHHYYNECRLQSSLQTLNLLTSTVASIIKPLPHQHSVEEMTLVECYALLPNQHPLDPAASYLCRVC